VGQTVACANQKGGVGKTTTVVNLGTYLALRGERVLIVDIDSQANATSGIGIDKTRIDRSVYDAVVDGAPLGELRIRSSVDGLDLIPASVSLAGAELELADVPDRERRLAHAIDDIVSEYDHVLLDCPPSLGLLTVNALTAADSVLIPIQCEYYALEGLTQLVATINLIRDRLNPALTITGVLLTMFDSRTNLSSEVAAEVRRHLGARVYDTVIPRSVRLAEAPSFGQPIALYRDDAKGARAYRDLAGEFLARRASRPVTPVQPPVPAYVEGAVA
jgi:chromosome partitioning protein